METGRLLFFFNAAIDSNASVWLSRSGSKCIYKIKPLKTSALEPRPQTFHYIIFNVLKAMQQQLVIPE